MVHAQIIIGYVLGLSGPHAGEIIYLLDIILSELFVCASRCKPYLGPISVLAWTIFVSDIVHVHVIIME